MNMGNAGRPRSSNPLSSIGRTAQRSFGVTSSGQVRRQSHKRRTHRGGYRMPAIVKKQIEANMRFQDQIVVALIAGAVHK